MLIHQTFEEFVSQVVDQNPEYAQYFDILLDTHKECLENVFMVFGSSVAQTILDWGVKWYRAATNTKHPKKEKESTSSTKKQCACGGKCDTAKQATLVAKHALEMTIHGRDLVLKDAIRRRDKSSLLPSCEAYIDATALEQLYGDILLNTEGVPAFLFYCKDLEDRKLPTVQQKKFTEIMTDAVVSYLKTTKKYQCKCNTEHPSTEEKNPKKDTKMFLSEEDCTREFSLGDLIQQGKENMQKEAVEKSKDEDAEDTYVIQVTYFDKDPLKDLPDTRSLSQFIDPDVIQEIMALIQSGKLFKGV